MVGICPSISVSREVLSACHDAFILHSFHISETLSRNIVYVFSEGSIIDHWIVRVIIDINDWCKVYMYTHPVTLVRYFSSHLIDKIIVLDGTQHQLSRIADDLIFKTHAYTPFSIYRYQHRNVAHVLIRIR